MAKTGKLIRLALFGSPVSQSQSPRIHHEFGKQTGLDVRYEAIEATSGTLSAALQEFEHRGGIGCNITMPLKNEARAIACSVSERVELADAANTLKNIGPGNWHAETTDGIGLVRDLNTCMGDITAARIAVIGAGGATSSVLASLLMNQPALIMIFNRTLSKADELAAKHSSLGQVETAGLETLKSASGFDLVINASSLGHEGTTPNMKPSLLNSGGLCYDMNYGQASIPLAKWCETHDIRYRDGLGMLAEQAATSFEIWTGVMPEAAPVLASLRQSQPGGSSKSPSSSSSG